MYAIFSKCDFLLTLVAFLEHVPLNEGVMVDPQTIEAVKSWVRTTSTTEVRNTVGLAIHYHQFVKNFASITTHLTNLTNKEMSFEWTEQCEEIFQKLKTFLTTTPILPLSVKVKILLFVVMLYVGEPILQIYTPVYIVAEVI